MKAVALRILEEEARPEEASPGMTMAIWDRAMWFRIENSAVDFATQANVVLYGPIVIGRERKEAHVFQGIEGVADEDEDCRQGHFTSSNNKGLVALL